VKISTNKLRIDGVGRSKKNRTILVSLKKTVCLAPNFSAMSAYRCGTKLTVRPESLRFHVTHDWRWISFLLPFGMHITARIEPGLLDSILVEVELAIRAHEVRLPCVEELEVHNRVELVLRAWAWCSTRPGESSNTSRNRQQELATATFP
jgi:hypothetical protein